jgi:pentose-5-phosphate-3-epimerase
MLAKFRKSAKHLLTKKMIHVATFHNMFGANCHSYVMEGAFVPNIYLYLVAIYQVRESALDYCPEI